MRFILGVFISSIFLFSCSGSNDNKADNNSDKEKLVVTQEKEVIEITIAAIGESMAEIAFDPSSISVPENSIVKLLFQNNSVAAGMLHNFVLVQQGSGNEIASKGLRAGKSKNFVPKDKRVFASTKVLNMGETITIEFDAPSKGSYHYICTFPGHTNMVGRFIVE